MNLVQLPNGVRMRSTPAAVAAAAFAASASVDVLETHQEAGKGDYGPVRSASAAGRCGTPSEEVYCSISGLGTVSRPFAAAVTEPIYVTRPTQTEEVVPSLTTTSVKSKTCPAAAAMSSDVIWDVLGGLNKVAGMVVMLVLSYKWSNYLATLHDNHFWFGNIQEVEREISFRTEQGLYYSYFKHLVSAPSLSEGIDQLKRDNLTEHLRTINIFHRFNIHQELFLATVYSVYDFGLKPIFFYVQFVFALQGFYLAVMYSVAWILSGTWAAGVLAAALAVAHRSDVTRVEFTIPLREHFSLPFIFAQFAVVGQYMDEKTNSKEKLYLITTFVLSFLLTITWQFAQFVLLLETIMLFGLALVGILDRDKVCKVMCCIFMSILTVWYTQFYQPMVLNSLVCSLIPICVVILQGMSEKRTLGVASNLAQVAAKVVGAFVAACALNALFKFMANQEADNHIFRFVQSKFGRVDETDFETRLYLCLPIFLPLQWPYYAAMSSNGALPAFAALVTAELICIVLSVFKRWSGKEKLEVDNNGKNADSSSAADNGEGHLARLLESLISYATSAHLRPGFCYHIGQSLILALLAMTTLRMKCFWGPYICILASVAVAHKSMWEGIAAKLTNQKSVGLANFLRHLVIGFVILTLFNSCKKTVYEELEDLREFYDPDTVELMRWINRETPRDAAFTGSMQLLAGVRLSTFRPLTNHPHFEDKELRERTKDLYQIYGKKSPSEVHDVLVHYNTSYIILEDSICLAPHEDRCSLGTTMDFTNGHIPDDGKRVPAHLIHSSHARFCLEIRYEKSEYAKYFAKVFENKTFRIFRVLP